MCIQSISHSSPASVISRFKPREYALRQPASCMFTQPCLTFAQKAHNIITSANSGGRKQSWIRLSAPSRDMLLPMLLLCWVLQIVPDLYYCETLFGLSNISSPPNCKLAAVLPLWKCKRPNTKFIAVITAINWEGSKQSVTNILVYIFV